jgi:ribosomal protein S2
MGLAFGCFNEFWWFFCFKNSGFVFNERVGLYFYDLAQTSKPMQITQTTQITDKST